jgi:hypothetical protein
MRTLWTVYERLQPLQYVARLSQPDEGGAEHLMVSSDLDALRSELQTRGLHPMAAHPDDDPMIVELWL